jgi:hypothetical protein
MYDHTAATRARTLLHGAARHLHTVDPVHELGDALDAALSAPAGDAAYRRKPTLEPRFSEGSAGTLSFDLLPGGPWASPSDRVAVATSTSRDLVGRSFGRDAVRWLDGRLEVAGALGGRSSEWGATLGSGFGRDGVMESTVHLEWGPQLMDSLPARLHRIAQVALETLPSLRPAFSTVRATRHGGTQQVTFDVTSALPLDRLGLGHQHAGLTSALALLLGARYILPPNAAMLTLRPAGEGVEFRVDVDLDAIPDPPPDIAKLLQLQMSERPRSLRAFRRWVAALTPEGHSGPGRLSVLSVVIGPNAPARLALNLAPAVVERSASDGGERAGQPPRLAPPAQATPAGSGDPWSSEPLWQPAGVGA